jgi:hypothetical protein
VRINAITLVSAMHLSTAVSENTVSVQAPATVASVGSTCAGVTGIQGTTVLAAVQAKAAAVFTLKPLASVEQVEQFEAVLRGYEAVAGVEQAKRQQDQAQLDQVGMQDRPVTTKTEDPTSHISTNGTNGTNPIDPWDLRSSSPPG